METSDSEYFESADEDFCSDDETEIKKTENVKENTVVKVMEKVNKLSLNDNLVCKSIEKESSNRKDDDNIDKGLKSNKQSEKTDCSDSSACHEYIDNNKKLQDLQNTQSNESVRIGACTIPRNNNRNQRNDNTIQSDINNSTTLAVSNTGCASEKTDDKLLEYNLQSNLHDIDETMKNIKERPTRPEFGIPPAIATCWEPVVTNITQPFQPHPAYEKLIENQKGITPEGVNSGVVTNVNTEPRRPEFGIPPARTTCRMPGVTRTGNNRDIQKGRNSDVTNPNKPQRPEYGIPPARTTCWIPGVTRTDNLNTSFEPHPAYLELMKQRELNSDLTSTSPNKLTQDVVNIDNAERPNCSKLIQKSAQSLEENMWDNEDDWDDFDILTKQNQEVVGTKDKKISIKQKESNDVEENMWDEDDDWEPVESNAQQQDSEKTKAILQGNQEKSSWGDWSSWGLSSVISTATTLTTQVSQGITNVLETGIGAPDPTELARINKLEKEKMKEAILVSNEEQPSEKPILGFGLGNLVQGVTKLVETTSNKVISGGLDTLESIGKKTMEVLQENDPGLKKKRAFLKLDDDKPILSQILREAKEKSDQENKELEKKHFAKRANYETLFDDHQGLVHLEALEMLSKQCDIKLQSLLESTSTDALNDIQETLDQVKELCELPEEDDEETLSMDEIKERLESAVSEINVKITYSRLLTTWEEVEDWLTNLNLKICNKNELHQQAIESLAQLTAIAVEQFHKAGALLLIKDHRSTADEADSLVQLTTTLTSLIGIVAARFSEKLNMAVVEGADKEINTLITNVFFEAANSSSYIQDAFQLLIPVLQVGAV